jgi:hypothetical protein
MLIFAARLIFAGEVTIFNPDQPPMSIAQETQLRGMMKSDNIKDQNEAYSMLTDAGLCFSAQECGAPPGSPILNQAEIYVEPTSSTSSIRQKDNIEQAMNALIPAPIDQVLPDFYQPDST